MHCDTVRAALLDYSNTEIAPIRAWAIRRHLAACAGCAQELAALHQFTTALRRADLVPPLSVPVAVPVRRLPLRRAFAAAGVALIVVALFLLPTLYQSRRNAQNPGAAVAAALGRVNTWHFSGWKLIDGRQVPWEVWGRRLPWLYYERVGDTTTWSDGKQRLRVFAPNPALKRPYGLVVKTSVDQASGGLGFLGDPAYQSLVNMQRARADFGDGATKLYTQTSTLARFRSQDAAAGPISGVNANKLYTISKRNWLPMTYQRHFDSRTFARDTEYLGVRYDVNLPDAILLPPSVSGYSVVDFTAPAKHADGFRVVAEPVGMDAAGNIVIVARGWLGGDRLTPGSTFSLDVQPYNGTFSAQRRGKMVKYIYATNSSSPPGSDIYIPFAPLEPSTVSGALPDVFSLSMTATPQILVRASDVIDSDGSPRPTTLSERLVSEEFQWRLRLPVEPVASLLAVLPPSQHRRLNLSSSFSREAQDQYPTQAYEHNLAELRRIYYFLSYDFQGAFYQKALPKALLRKFRNPDGSLDYMRANASLPPQQLDTLQRGHAAEYKATERDFRRRAVYWQERKLELLPQGGATHGERDRNLWQHAYDVELLAICYDRAGDKAGRDRTLRRLIGECQVLPSQGGLLRRQAKYALRTGSFPIDADYKGPS